MRSQTAPEQDESPRAAGDPPSAIFTRFLKFGLLAWGGPAAQIAMIKRECVDEEGWVDEETFKKTLAVYQVLPGLVLMLGLSIAYSEANLAGHLDELFYGLTAAVGAIVARALVRLSRTFITDVPLAVIAGVGFALTLFVHVPFVLVLL